MGSSTDGSPAAQGAPQDMAADEPSEAAGRGFFGRLLSAFTPNPETEAGQSAPLPAANPGLSALRRLRVDDVAIPKSEIVAVPLDIGKDDLVEMFREHGFSRVPVYKGTLDHPQGLVLLKDLALQHGFGASGRFSLKRFCARSFTRRPRCPPGFCCRRCRKSASTWRW